MHSNNPEGDERIRGIDKNLKKVIIALIILLIAFFIADLCTSYISVCQQVNGSYECGLEPVINLLPKISR